MPEIKTDGFPSPCISCGRLIVTSDNRPQCMECHDFAQAFDEHEPEVVGWIDDISYSEYLKTDHWGQMRQIKLDACGRKCAACASTLQLHVHHREYPQYRLDIKPSMLVVLCKRCHELLHPRG